jgi:chemotaxis protein CheX
MTEPALTELAESHLAAITEEIWLSVLGLPTRPAGLPAHLRLEGPTLDGVISITGDWHGAVMVQLPRELATRVAGAFFGLDDREPSLQDVQDAVGELTNMTGGNIKALMPGECSLSLPAVVEGRDYSLRIPSTTVVARIVFDCAGAPFVVTLLGGTRGVRGPGAAA